jgi:predicted NAD-dependent protein-ADP-ribosyltransferase YbiA (DUF1768 family)
VDRPRRPPGQRDVTGFASGIRVIGVSPDNQWLAPGSPHPVTINKVKWPTALHAYWAASTQDPDLIKAIRSCDSAADLGRLMRDAPRRDRWAEIRLAAMAGVLRLKFSQHPDLADKLTATGDSLLAGHYLMGSDFWDNQGQNWIGRLLELIRAELIAANPGA